VFFPSPGTPGTGVGVGKLRPCAANPDDRKRG